MNLSNKNVNLIVKITYYSKTMGVRTINTFLTGFNSALFN